MKVLGFGDNIVDRFVDRRTLYPGGNCVNVAVFARQLGATASYLGVFGDDERAELLRGALTAEGVDHSRAVTVPGASGVTDITVSQGERVFGGWNGGGVSTSEPLTLTARLLDYISGFDLVHISVYAGAEKELSKLAGVDTLVSFDFSSEEKYRSDDYLALVCPAVDLALISASQLGLTETAELLDRLVEAGAGMALATRGTAGSVLRLGDELIHSDAVPVPADEIVDTMGCGDAYLAAFAVHALENGWTRGHQPDATVAADALSRAAEFAAQQCRVPGAFDRGVTY